MPWLTRSQLALKLPSLLGRMDSSEKVKRAALLTIRSCTDGEADSSFVLRIGVTVKLNSRKFYRADLTQFCTNQIFVP